MIGSVTIKILVQSVNVGQIAKKTIQSHIPKDLKILNDTPTNTQHHTQSITCAKPGKLGLNIEETLVVKIQECPLLI